MPNSCVIRVFKAGSLGWLFLLFRMDLACLRAGVQRQSGRSLMFHYIKKGRAGCLLLAAALVAPAAISADGLIAGLDPKAIAIRLPADMQWKSGGLSGAES